MSAANRIADEAGALKLAADALLKMHGCITRQVVICEERVVSLRMRGGFLSLPDEILTIVLELATVHQGIQRRHFSLLESVQAAKGLTHVCQRFRSLMLNASSFWCHIWNWMEPDMVNVL